MDDSKAMRSVHAAVESSVDRLFIFDYVFLGPVTPFSLVLGAECTASCLMPRNAKPLV